MSVKKKKSSAEQILDYLGAVRLREVKIELIERFLQNERRAAFNECLAKISVCVKADQPAAKEGGR